MCDIDAWIDVQIFLAGFAFRAVIFGRYPFSSDPEMRASVIMDEISGVLWVDFYVAVVTGVCCLICCFEFAMTDGFAGGIFYDVVPAAGTVGHEADFPDVLPLCVKSVIKAADIKRGLVRRDEFAGKNDVRVIKRVIERLFAVDRGFKETIKCNRFF